MRKGFTMIELIFVIVIIGILAAVAVPKMMGTRDDAKISAQLALGKQAIDNLGAEYTAKGVLPQASIDAANNGLDCFEITKGTGEGNVSIEVKAKDSARCPDSVVNQLKTLAAKNGLTGAGGAKKYYGFGSTGVVR